MKRSTVWLSLMVASLGASAAGAQTITSRTETRPFVGVRVIVGRTASPTANFRATVVSLCDDYVHVTATRAPSALQRTSAWATAAGVQVATNGDFFASGPRVYGQAIGGAAWPLRQTGVDPAVAGEWYYRRHGWIGFGPSAVEFSHTEWVKQRASSLGVTDGWMPATVTSTVPRGLTALVSGFPELITEGARYTCASPTAASCFPDRTDMRARNPRTAMGLSRDRRTFLLVTVDGRSSASAGMYGTELARLMELLGAWQAFNLDGGGSTAMWVRGRGVINVPSDASGERAVANHWGIFAGAASARPRAPGSCRAIPSLDAGVADAGTIDAGPADVGVAEVGARDVGVADVGARDVGVADVGLADVGARDAGTADAGPSEDAPDEDAGPVEEIPEFADASRGEMPPVEVPEEGGCGCRAGRGGGLDRGALVAGALLLVRRRRRGRARRGQTERVG